MQVKTLPELLLSSRSLRRDQLIHQQYCRNRSINSDFNWTGTQGSLEHVENFDAARFRLDLKQLSYPDRYINKCRGERNHDRIRVRADFDVRADSGRITDRHTGNYLYAFHRYSGRFRKRLQKEERFR